MKFYLGKRRSGKTTALLQWMTDAPEGVKRIGVFMNANFAEIQRKESEKRGDNLEPWQFITFDQLTGNSSTLHGRSEELELGIDEFPFMRFGIHRIGFVNGTIEFGDLTIIA